MKFPASMLRDFVETRLSAEQLGDLLTMAGFELEGIEEVEGEPVLDIKVVSNRGDGLSVFGLAREVLAKDPDAQPTDHFRRASERFPRQATLASGSDLVTIETTECSRYACRIYKDVRNGTAPEWVQQRLRQAGMRPISLLVDLTNYVMLELGQPLHAFDYDKLENGQIVVRKARLGERITTLDGKEHDLTPEMMMICDAQRPVAVAGVMGGIDTEVSDSTRTMLLESAHFENTSVRRTRRALGLSTEASYRFERSVDPEGVVAAIERFTELFEQAQGGTAEPEMTDVYPRREARTPVRLRLDRAERLLGMEIPSAEAVRHLSRLGFAVEGPHDALTVVPPSWRPDIQREEDVVEELGRVHGYERIPERLPVGATTQGGVHGYQLWKERVLEQAVRLGFAQTISHTLRSASPLDSPRGERIGPRGVSDPEMMYLRNSVLPSLADAARRNGGRDVHLFEVGETFGRDADGTIWERTTLGFLSQGAWTAASWEGGQPPQASFFTLKGVIEDLLAATVGGAQFAAAAVHDPRFHPTRQAEIAVGGEPVGLLGQIHPDAAEESGLPPDTVLAEIQLLLAFERAQEVVRFAAVSRNPAVRRDIAFLIDRAVPFSRVSNAIESAAGADLERHWLFDVYSGQGVPEGSHSLAVALQLRKHGATFTDEEANQVREKVVRALAELGATPR